MSMTISADAEGMPKIKQCIVPYPGRSVVDQVDETIAHLKTLILAIRGASQGIGELSMYDIDIVLSDAMLQIDPIRRFLANNDFDDREISFLECRLASAADTGGAA